MALAGEGRVEKRFRVAREGQTVDGRELTGQEIQQMGASYSLEKYGARINLEHYSGWSNTVQDQLNQALGPIIQSLQSAYPCSSWKSRFTG